MTVLRYPSAKISSKIWAMVIMNYVMIRLYNYVTINSSSSVSAFLF